MHLSWLFNQASAELSVQQQKQLQQQAIGNNTRSSNEACYAQYNSSVYDNTKLV